MEDIMRTFYNFWSSFGIPAYPEDGVPDDAELPYITYNISVPDWREPTLVNARVWYRSTSYSEVSAMAGTIAEAIGEGKSLGNGVYIYKDSNFLQFQPYDASEDAIKIAYLSMVVNVFH